MARRKVRLAPFVGCASVPLPVGRHIRERNLSRRAYASPATELAKIKLPISLEISSAIRLLSLRTTQASDKVRSTCLRGETLREAAWTLVARPATPGRAVTNAPDQGIGATNIDGAFRCAPSSTPIPSRSTNSPPSHPVITAKAVPLRESATACGPGLRGYLRRKNQLAANRLVTTTFPNPM
jgi:hypothetical protein